MSVIVADRSCYFSKDWYAGNLHKVIALSRMLMEVQSVIKDNASVQVILYHSTEIALFLNPLLQLPLCLYV